MTTSTTPGAVPPHAHAPWRRSLSRHTTDRDAGRRRQEGLLTALLEDGATRVVLVDSRGRVGLSAPSGVDDLPDDGLTPPPGDKDAAAWRQAGQDHPGDGPALHLAPLTTAGLPEAVRAALATATAAGGDVAGPAGLAAYYLGQEGTGQGSVPWVAVHLSQGLLAATQGEGASTAPDGPRAPEGLAGLLRQAPLTALRAIGTDLPDRDAGLASAAAALAAWHEGTRFCTACGAGLTVTEAGWARRCTGCGTLTFPRQDPAVIMQVTDEHDRLLLVHGATWAPGRYSVTAGFVEAGESGEQAVYREVWEEAGLRVESVELLATQPWPFPRSLMLGFRARLAAGEHLAVPDGEEVTGALLVSREELTEGVREGRLSLPGPTSIARLLIEDWYGGPVPD